METKEKEIEIMEFLSKAWCIDGSVSCEGNSEVWVKGFDDSLDSRTYKLTDSIRGEIYITLSTKPNSINP